MQPFDLETLGVSTDSGVFGAGSASQAILGLSGLRGPLWGEAPDDYPEFAFLDRAYDEGYRVMDTAAIYGLGASEKTLGRWMQLRRNREQIAVISKGGHPPLLRPGRHRLTAECLDQDLRASLRRLRTDYIDLYLLHRDGQGCDVPAVMQYLHEQRQRGTIRAIGASNWVHARVQEANVVARQGGLAEFSVSSPQLSLLSWVSAPWRGCVSVSGSEGAAARDWYRAAGLPLLAWSPFGGGLRETPVRGGRRQASATSIATTRHAWRVPRSSHASAA